MMRRYSFLITFAVLLSGLSGLSRWFERFGASSNLEAVSFSKAAGEGGSIQHRRELIEALDHLVHYQHYYRSVYGEFTPVLGRLGFGLPGTVLENFEIRVEKANRESVYVTAHSIHGMDHVTIDQDFKIQSNFEIPLPKPEHLRFQALRHLVLLSEAPRGQRIEEQGVFRGYFQYEVQESAEGRKLAVARGIRAPVIGLQLEGGKGSAGPSAQSSLLSDGDEAFWGEDPSAAPTPLTGQGQATTSVMSPGEEARLAQRIFKGEMGRYARNLAELSRITSFSFGRENHAPERVPAQQSSRLEIEPISADEYAESGAKDSRKFDTRMGIR